jgi:Ca2+-binding EF-hand superfamily protein
MLENMLIHDRHMRPSVLEALDHPFISNTYGKPIHDDKIEKQAKAVLVTLAESFQSFSRLPILKRSMLLVLSHIVSCGDGLAKAQRIAYRKLDKVGSGELSADALESGMRFYDVDVPSDLDDVFTYLDTDNDGYICFVDFLSATLPHSIACERAQLENLFGVLDMNKDKRVDTHDLAQALRYDLEHDVLAEKMCSDAICEAGMKPEGFSCEEFIAFMQNMPSDGNRVERISREPQSPKSQISGLSNNSGRSGGPRQAW